MSVRTGTPAPFGRPYRAGLNQTRWLMARYWMIAGIWVLAASFGILGYQALTYRFYAYWPPVTVGFIWGRLFGSWPTSDIGWVNAAAAWYGGSPLFASGVAVAYLCFMVADLSRRR